MIINEEGTYTLRYTATDECGKTTTIDRELKVERPVFGVEWDGSASSSWTRTDSASLFADPVPQHSDGNGGWVDGSSPFDDVMPWSGIEVVSDPVAGSLVKIPKYWYKITQDGSAMKIQISNKDVDGFATSPAHADRGDGVGERDFVYVGRYHCASDYKSKTNTTPTGNKTFGTMWSGIHNLGSDIWMWDYAMYMTICMLYLVEFADWNSQKKIGGGCSDNSYVQYTGRTDSMTYHTGTTNSVIGAENYGHVRYRYIEDLWANVYDFVAGLFIHKDNSRQGVFIQNRPSYQQYNDGDKICERIGASGIPTGFVTPPSGYEYALYPNNVSGNDYNSNLCDLYNSITDESGIHFYVGGDYAKNQMNGLFSMREASPTFKSGGLGSRLMKLPSV